MTRLVTRSRRFVGLAFVAGALVVSCGAGQGGADGGGPDALHDALEVSDDARSEADDAFELAPLPPLVRECGACHDLDDLALPVVAAGLEPGLWLETAGVGLVRDDPVIPVPGVRLVDPWPGRGHHAAAETEGCGACHPVDLQGAGHDLLTYPVPGAAFSGGASCAGSCHSWLTDEALRVGFGSGAPVFYEPTGSLRPDVLLAEVPTAHATLWREGARAEGLRLAVVRPGCGGCHNARSEAHGALLTCLDCHTLGGPEGALHEAHVAAIDAGQEQADPDGAAAGVSACGYCHDADDGVPLERWRRGCHGCHLSGHQPRDATGRPHFWPQLR